MMTDNIRTEMHECYQKMPLNIKEGKTIQSVRLAVNTKQRLLVNVNFIYYFSVTLLHNFFNINYSLRYACGTLEYTYVS